MSREYYPDRWEIVEITHKDQAPFRKVLAGWFGGYAGSDSWRFSSPIQHEEEIDGVLVCTTASGNKYYCPKATRGFSSLTGGVFNTLKERGLDADIKVEIVKVLV